MEAQREMELRKQKQLVEMEEMDSAKKALLDQYAYDTSEQFDKDGNVIDPSSSSSNKKSGSGSGSGSGTGTGASSAEGDGDVSNRAVAQKAQMEKAQNLRKAQNTSKKDERIKTKNAKLDKMKQKEERRKRATKGERRR